MGLPLRGRRRTTVIGRTSAPDERIERTTLKDNSMHYTCESKQNIQVSISLWSSGLLTVNRFSVSYRQRYLSIALLSHTTLSSFQ